MRWSHRLIFPLALVLIVAVPWVVHACPNCKNSLPDSDDVDLITRLRDGYFWSYIGMSSMPFVALGTIGVKLYRRTKAAEAAENSAPSTL